MQRHRNIGLLAAVALAGIAPSAVAAQTQVAPASRQQIEAEKRKAEKRKAKTRATPPRRRLTATDEQALRIAEMKRARKAAKRSRDAVASAAGHYRSRSPDQ